MNQNKLVDYLVNQAETIYDERKEGWVTIPGSASVPDNADEAFVAGMSYAYRQILGDIASGMFI